MSSEMQVTSVQSMINAFFEKEQYPEFSFCFKEVALEIAKMAGSADYRLIQLIVNPGGEDIIKKLERLIKRVRSDILGISQNEFVKAYGINSKWLSGDKGAFSDVLAEIAVCAELYQKGGFRNWKKLSSKKKSTGDYSATNGNEKFVIEIKHVRENKTFEEKSLSSELAGWYNTRHLWDRFTDFLLSDTILNKAIAQLNAEQGVKRVLVYAHGRDMISAIGNEDDLKAICYKLKEKVGDKVDYAMFMSLRVEDTYFFDLNNLETL